MQVPVGSDWVHTTEVGKFAYGFGNIPPCMPGISARWIGDRDRMDLMDLMACRLR